MSILEIQDLSCVLGGNPILSGINLTVSPGETIGIIGPNGSGKTTLFNCISGFSPANAGKIIFREQEVTRWEPSSRANLGLGRVFQNFGVFSEMTLLENMLTALESKRPGFWPWSKGYAENKILAMDYLEQVHLAAKAHDKASSLSGGQKRLLEIMRTLAFEAELFLLDEPTAGVSPKMKDDVAALIERLKSLRKTVMIIEHDISFIQRFCERILVLDVGKIVLDDTPANVRANPALQEIYFGNQSH